MIHRAVIFAAMKHRNQVRKSTDIPYITHPMEVIQILTAMGCSEDVIVAGILHDTLEDTDTKPAEIRELFGDKILSIVQTESEDKSRSWRERKQTTIDELKNADIETKLVCFADKLSNIRSIYADLQEIGNRLWDRFNADRDSIRWYYESISAALKDVIPEKFMKEFDSLIKASFS